ncbi:hypothetical protein Cassandra_0483 [Pseudomonas phage Cassandra]|nr:hypothetical protein Cassandra_0483 [Pseudomonas phage Cassandra]
MNYRVKHYRYRLIDGGYLVKDLKKNTETSLVFTGTYVKSYVQDVGENLINILNNFSYHLPPVSAVTGQLWWKENTRQMYIFPGPNGLDSTNINNWVPITKFEEDAVWAHITNYNNPHLVDKYSVKLDKLENYPIFDISKNFADVLNASSARTNLGVFGKDVTYTKAEADSLFLKKTDKAANSNNLNGIPAAKFMKVAAPVANAAINVTPSDGLMSFRSGKSYLESRGISNGLSINNTIATNNSSATILELNNTTLSTSSVFIKLYNRGSLNTTPVLALQYRLSPNQLYIGNNQVFHLGYRPTPAQIGALPVNGKASDSAALDGRINSTLATPGTVVERDSSGAITGRLLRSTGNNTSDQFTRNSKIGFVRSNSNNTMRFTPAQALNEWAGYNTLIKKSKGWISWSGPTGSRLDSWNLTVSKLASGRYRVYLSVPAPDTNYVVVLGNADAMVWNNQLNITEQWVTTKTTTYFDVNCKITKADHIINYNPSGWTNRFGEDYFDAPFFSLVIYY